MYYLLDGQNKILMMKISEAVNRFLQGYTQN